MRVDRMSPAIDIAVCCGLLFSSAVSVQTPPQPARLSVTSTPKGATIMINGQTMSQKTDAVFVVSAGHYKVTIAGGAGSPSCPEKDVQVVSGQTLEVACP